MAQRLRERRTVMEVNRRGSIGALLVACLAVGGVALGSQPLRAAEPIRIGFGMALTGPLAANGKSALLAMKIWESDINAKGGLLGRPVKLVYYDDQSNPATIPGLYTKLLDVDKVDLIISGYATNMIAPAMPVIMQHNRTFLSLLGLAVNSEFQYPKYFSFTPTGGPKPKQQTLAMVGADAEFPHNAMDGARALAKKHGLKIVYDQTYPPATTDYTPIVRAIQATNPDLVLVCSYPPDTVGMVRAAHEVGLKTRLFGGGMVGLQSTAIKMQLGPLLNGIVDYDFWLPWSRLASDESKEFLRQYQEKAPSAGVDPLGYYLPPFAFGYMQVLQQAVEGGKSLDQDKLADYLRSHTFKTIVGDVKFGPNGEWAEPRVLEVQFQNVKANDLDQFKDPKTEVILWPPSLKTGELMYPFTD